MPKPQPLKPYTFKAKFKDYHLVKWLAKCMDTRMHRVAEDEYKFTPGIKPHDDMVEGDRLVDRGTSDVIR